MREIKFRAWDKKYSKMYYGDIKIALAFPDEDVVIEQFTGLKDKNGKDIYEGDILGPMPNDHTPEYKGNWIVIYDGGAFFGQAPDGYEETWIPYWKPDTQIEVIGNIHENPKAASPGEKG